MSTRQWVRSERLRRSLTDPPQICDLHQAATSERWQSGGGNQRPHPHTWEGATPTQWLRLLFMGRRGLGRLCDEPPLRPWVSCCLRGATVPLSISIIPGQRPQLGFSLPALHAPLHTQLHAQAHRSLTLFFIFCFLAAVPGDSSCLFLLMFYLFSNPR